jgi:hypothetical protein
VPDDGACVLADAHCPAIVREACDRRGVSMVEPTWTGAGVMMAARSAWARGVQVLPASIEPEYAREPEAVTLWRRRHGG